MKMGITFRKKQKTMAATKSTLLVVANILAFAGVLLVNYLANALPIAGRTPGGVSDMFPTLFTPAGFTFSIWGVIYLLVLGFVGYTARFINKSAPAFLHHIGWLFVGSCLANIAWIFAFHNLQIGLSMLVMLLLLGSLLGIYLRVADSAGMERWFVRLPFSVYLGWVSVATIANASILLTHWGWDGSPGGPQFWTVVVIAAAVGLGVWALWSRRDFAYALVIAWALYGIFSKRIADLGTADGMVETASLAGIAILSLGIAYRLIKR